MGVFLSKSLVEGIKKIMMTNSIPDPHHHFYVPFHNLTLGIMVPSDEDLSQGYVLDQITKLPTF